jgi:hypothetical protein
MATSWYQIQVRGKWAGVTANVWRPVAGGNFDTHREATEALVDFEFDADGSTVEGAEFRVVKVQKRGG